jgi:hypothetical protein
MANTNPIFSSIGSIGNSGTLTTAAADYTGLSVNNQVVFNADPTNGSFVQRLRLKAIGTNIATVARIYINNGSLRLATTLSAPAGTPTGTPSASGGTLASGNLFAKIVAVDQWGGLTALSTETASVSVTGPTGSVTWNWTASTGAVSYRIYVGPATGNQITYFTSTTNSYVQTAPTGTGTDNAFALVNNVLYGEISLPATTAASASATTEVDYPLNIALPPGYRLIVGLGTTVSAGWIVTTIGGNY